MRALKAIFVVTMFAFLVAVAAHTRQKQASDSDYIAHALSAAPEAVANEQPSDGGEPHHAHPRPGNNGFTCMIVGMDRMCNDRNSMEFIDALMKHAPPPDKVGISYMLAGDEEASNTDPYASGKTADNHWLVTGPHIMVFGPPSKTLGYTQAKDPDPNEPYMMWAGTPYEHP